MKIIKICVVLKLVVYKQYFDYSSAETYIPSPFLYGYTWDDPLGTNRHLGAYEVRNYDFKVSVSF